LIEGESGGRVTHDELSFMVSPGRPAEQAGQWPTSFRQFLRSVFPKLCEVEEKEQP
jgi:hypothetical protein